MKFQLLVLSALFAGAAASYGFFKTFDDCYEQGPSLVEGTESCKGSSEENSGSGSHESSTGFTESSTGFTESSTGFTESSTLFSTASLGYTPSPGECVCITDEPSSTISVSSSFGSSSSAVPSSSFGSSSSALPSSSPSSLGTSTQSVITCPCQLIDLLYGLLPCLEGTPYYDIFLEFIISIQVEILVDQSLSYEEKLNACLGQLTVLLELNYEMMVILKVQPLPGFGYFCDLITWSQQYQMEVNITTVMFVADESGSCPLEQAMLNCSTCTADEISLIEEFWAEINITLTGDYTFEEMCVLFWQQFSVFIEMHVELKAKILSLPIPGFGVCGQFFDLCETYYMLYSLEFSIGGSVEVNAYLQAIQVAIDNCEDAALVVQLQQYYQTMCAEFDAEDDCNIRLDLIVNSTYSFLSGQSWNTEFLYAIRFNYTCEGVTTELCLYDLLFIAYFRYKFGFNCGLEPGKSSEESTSSSVSPSTEAPFLLNCSDVYGIELASNFDECNYTNYAVYSMRDAYNNSGWTTACKNSLLTVINNCQKQSDGPEVSWQTQLDKMVYYLTLNPANSDEYMNILFNVVVTLSDGRQWGRVHHLGLCTPYGDLCPTCMS